MAEELTLEPYQQKLQAFIARVPADPKTINSGTPVMPYPTMEKIDAVRKDVKTDPDFLDLTGKTHLALLEEWTGTSILTTCNLFVGRCANKMGFTAFSLGQFEIAKILYGAGMGFAWVPASCGARPRYGDVFKPLKTHMGISLDFVGDTWRTVESGQGGKSTGCDKIKRKEAPWNPGGLEGWVDMGTLLAATGKPLPSWLGGWWQVTEDGSQIYFYHFDASGVVSFTPVAPATAFSRPVNPSMTGAFRVERYSDVTIRWKSADDDETLQRVYNPTPKTTPEKMAGIKNDKNRYVLRKMAIDGTISQK